MSVNADNNQLQQPGQPLPWNVIAEKLADININISAYLSQFSHHPDVIVNGRDVKAEWKELLSDYSNRQEEPSPEEMSKLRRGIAKLGGLNAVVTPILEEMRSNRLARTDMNTLNENLQEVMAQLQLTPEEQMNLPAGLPEQNRERYNVLATALLEMAEKADRNSLRAIEYSDTIRQLRAYGQALRDAAGIPAGDPEGVQRGIEGLAGLQDFLNQRTTHNFMNFELLERWLEEYTSMSVETFEETLTALSADVNLGLDLPALKNPPQPEPPQEQPPQEEQPVQVPPPPVEPPKEEQPPQVEPPQAEEPPQENAVDVNRNEGGYMTYRRAYENILRQWDYPRMNEMPYMTGVLAERMALYYICQEHAEERYDPDEVDRRAEQLQYQNEDFDYALKGKTTQELREYVEHPETFHHYAFEEREKTETELLLERVSDRYKNRPELKPVLDDYTKAASAMSDLASSLRSANNQADLDLGKELRTMSFSTLSYPDIESKRDRGRLISVYSGLPKAKKYLQEHTEQILRNLEQIKPGQGRKILADLEKGLSTFYEFDLELNLPEPVKEQGEEKGGDAIDPNQINNINNDPEENEIENENLKLDLSQHSEQQEEQEPNLINNQAEEDEEEVEANPNEKSWRGYALRHNYYLAGPNFRIPRGKAPEYIAKSMVAAAFDGTNKPFSVGLARTYASNLMENPAFKQLTKSMTHIENHLHMNNAQTRTALNKMLWPFRRDPATQRQTLEFLRGMLEHIDGPRGRTSKWQRLYNSINDIDLDKPNEYEKQLKNVYKAAENYIKGKKRVRHSLDGRKRFDQALDVLATLGGMDEYTELTVKPLFERTNVIRDKHHEDRVDYDDYGAAKVVNHKNPAGHQAISHNLPAAQTKNEMETEEDSLSQSQIKL